MYYVLRHIFLVHQFSEMMQVQIIAHNQWRAARYEYSTLQAPLFFLGGTRVNSTHKLCQSGGWVVEL